MKAIEYKRYGSPDVLELNEVDIPTPADNEVLVKVYAAATNPLDWHLMRGEPFLARFENGLRTPKNSRLGADIAGRVEAIGKNVTRFKIGDEVFGSIYMDRLGGFAEYACTLEDLLVSKPAKISFEQAAATPVVGFTAIQGLRDTGKLQAGQKVLVNGASGGVGHFAVQYAKSVGAEVTGVCSTRNLDMVRSIGADHVIDYTKEDFTKSGQQFDLIYDAVGNYSLTQYSPALVPNGRCVVAGFTTLSRLFPIMLFGSLLSKLGNKQIGLMKTAHANQQDLLLIRELLESGKVAPVIDKCYPLQETAEAIRYLETGRARGKVIVMLEQK